MPPPTTTARASARHARGTSLISPAPPARAAQLEFIIHADGRVEERVRGIKGGNCQSITAAIEEALGEVYESKATEEMFEQEVELSVSDEVGQEVTADWKGTSEW